MMNNIPNYQEVYAALAPADDLITPAELHGILCGLIFAGLKKLDTDSLEASLMLHLPHAEEHPDANDILDRLFKGTYQQIREFELEFQLLLPDDDVPLVTRAHEFGKWCEGFMAGMGLSGVQHSYRDETEVADILEKFSNTAKIDFNTLTFTHEDENDFVDVVEFARISVFTVYQELTDVDVNGSSSSSSKMLH